LQVQTLKPFISGFASTNPETLLWYEETGKILLQNIQKGYGGRMAGATRY
jgi:hypothetical protein